MSTKNKTAYFEWLRVFAAAAVVLMHTAGSRWLSIPHTSPDWLPLTAWDSLVRWPVPIFLMITGALFLPRQTALKTVLTRYIPRMAAAFVIWSGVYALHTGGDFPAKLAAGHYHLWYLPFLCGVYLALPFLQRIVTDEGLTRQLLAVSCVFGLGIPWLADAAVLLWPGSSQVVRAVENHVNFSFFMDHLAILLLGHRLHRADLGPRSRRVLYALGLAGAAVTGAATVWASGRTAFQNSVFFDFTAPNNLCAAAALFVFAKYNLRSLPRAVAWMAERSFGVYLVHALVIELLAEQGIHVLTWNPVWSVPVLAAAVFAISLALTAALSRLPLVGKYLT